MSADRTQALGSATQPASGLAWLEASLVLLMVAAFAYIAGSFAEHQAIWVDETTQLSGLALPFGEQLAWLAGRSDIVPGVPHDRMPPMSYWIGSLWAAVFGLSESAMRWMGIIAICTAAPALYLAGRITGGRAGGLFVLGVILLSGNVIGLAGDIRAYPLFFTFAAWASYFFVRLVCDDDRAGDRRHLVLLCLFLLLATYTHFFGLVAAACIMAALWADRLLKRRRTAPVVAAASAFGLLSLGIVPFVLAAIAASDGAGESISAAELSRDVARLVFRIFVHPSQLVLTSALAAFLVGLAVLLGIVALRLRAALPSVRRAEEAGSDASSVQAAVLAAPIVLALMVLIAAKFAISSFEVLAPHYNIWLVPLAGIVLGFAFRQTGDDGYLRPAALVAGGVIIFCGLVGVASLLRHAELYSHGPGEWVAEQIRAPDKTLIVHDGSGQWGHLYFPLYFLTGGAVEQWLYDKEYGRFRHIIPGGLEPVIDPNEQRKAYETVMEVHTIGMNSTTLAAIARGKRPCAFELADGPLPRTAAATPVSFYCAFFATRLTINAP